MKDETSDHVRRNQRHWDGKSALYQRTHGVQLSVEDPVWGIWSIPERELRILGDVVDRDILELGCGGANWSIALARQGARCTGIDLSWEQLRHARGEMVRHGVSVRLVHGNAEAPPFRQESFDIVFCDHGAMSFTDPYHSVPAVARMLRPGGLFAFNSGTPILEVCWDPATNRPGERLQADYFGLHRLEDADSTIFQLGYGEWIRLFRSAGLVIEDLVEIQPPLGAWTTYEDYAPLSWARRWPAEQIWKLRRAGPGALGAP